MRSTLRTATSAVTRVPSSMAGRHASRNVVECLVETVVLFGHPVAHRAVRCVGWLQDGRQVEPRRFPVVDGGGRVEQVDTTHGLLDRAQAQGRQVLPDLLGDVLEERLDELGRSGEPLAQHRVLGGDPHRAGVEVADAHHDAARHHQRRGGEAVLLGAEQRADHHVRGPSSSARRPGPRCGHAGRWP